MTGTKVGAGAIVIVSVPDPVAPELLLHVRFAVNEPDSFGVPLICPVDGLIATPDGNPVPPKVVAPSATTENAKGYPTMPDALFKLEMGIEVTTGGASAA